MVLPLSILFYTNKKTVEILGKLSFTGGNAESCLYMKKRAKGMVYIALYVDDNLVAGSPEEIDKSVEQLKTNGQVLKVIEST